MSFVENRSQVDRRVRSHVQGGRHAFYLTRDAIAPSLQRESGRGVALWLRYLGADAGGGGEPARARDRQLPPPRRVERHPPHRGEMTSNAP
jgi:hypothetical protein